MKNDVNSRADRFIGDLLGWARQFGKGIEEIETQLMNSAAKYRYSEKWKAVPVRFPDAIELPDVSGEIEWR